MISTKVIDGVIFVDLNEASKAINRAIRDERMACLSTLQENRENVSEAIKLIFNRKIDWNPDEL